MTAPNHLGIEGLTDFRELGVGGFSRVYAAVELDFGRAVAVKVLRGLDEAGLRRFDRELAAMGQLDDHPNVITPYRSGLTAAGDRYLVMELAGGGSLEDHLRRSGPMRWDDAVRLLTPIADAVGYGHARGIEHRDIKPANILLTAGGVPKLTDFGIAMLKEVTSTANIGYTLSHSPPETFASGTDDRGPRSDLYSLASTLFALVTGSAPFDVAGQDSPPAYMHRILTYAPPTLGGDPWRDSFLRSALAKDPAARPRSAAHFSEMLLATTASSEGWAGRAVDGPQTDRPVFDRAAPPMSLEAPPPAQAATGRFSLSARALALGLVAGLAVAGAVLFWALRDRSTVEPVVVFADHQQVGDSAVDDVKAVVALSDGRVVSASEDGLVLVWDPGNLEQEAITRRDHVDGVNALAVLEDGRVASGSFDGTVAVWSAQEPSAAAVVFAEHAADAVDPGQDNIRAVAGLPGGSVASGGADGTVRVWDPDAIDAGSIARLDSHRQRTEEAGWGVGEDDVRALAATADGRIVSGGRDGTVHVWDPTLPAEAATVFNGHIDRASSVGGDDVWAVAVLGDGRIASGGAGGDVLVWDPSQPEVEPSASLAHGADVRVIAALADGRIVSGGGTGELLVWDPDVDDPEIVSFTQHGAPVRSLAVLADGRVVSGDEAGIVLVWSPT